MYDLQDLLDEFGNDIYNFCRYLAKTKENSDDLFQDTMMRAIELSYKIDNSRNPKSFIISIAINIWRNKVQKDARRKFIAGLIRLDEDGIDQIVDKKVNIEKETFDNIVNLDLHNAINSLSDRLRVPIILFYLEEMKISEISKILNRPEGTIKRQLYEAREKIKYEMEAKGYE